MDKKSDKRKRQDLADARYKELEMRQKQRGILGKLKAGWPGTKEWDEDREAESTATNMEYHFDQDTLDRLRKEKGVKQKQGGGGKKLSKQLKDLS